MRFFRKMDRNLIGFKHSMANMIDPLSLSVKAAQVTQKLNLLKLYFNDL